MTSCSFDLIIHKKRELNTMNYAFQEKNIDIGKLTENEIVIQTKIINNFFLYTSLLTFCATYTLCTIAFRCFLHALIEIFLLGHAMGEK